MSRPCQPAMIFKPSGQRAEAQKLLTPGTSSSVNWTTGGRPSGSIRIEVGTDFVRLVYRTRTHGEEWEGMSEVVRFRETNTSSVAAGAGSHP